MTIEELFGTLQQAVTSGWRKHLRTAKYAKHEALDEFYKEMPEKVDALIEAWMGANGKKVKGYTNLLTSSNMNTLKYLIELKKVCKDGYDLLDDNEELESLLDDIVNLINSTLYKVKELSESSIVSLAEYVNVQINEAENINEGKVYFGAKNINKYDYVFINPTLECVELYDEKTLLKMTLENGLDDDAKEIKKLQYGMSHVCEDDSIVVKL